MTDRLEMMVEETIRDHHIILTLGTMLKDDDIIAAIGSDKLWIMKVFAFVVIRAAMMIVAEEGMIRKSITDMMT